MKNVILVLLALLFALIATSCGREERNIESIEKPNKIATDDEGKGSAADAVAEPSPNVNGMRFQQTLYEFTERYNQQKRLLGQTDLIIAGNWQKKGDSVNDNNGVTVQYYYYDDYNVNITATVEVESGKLINVGCGTTLSYFMSQNGDINNSDLVLRKAAAAAQAAMQLDSGSTDVLQDIFYRIATGSNDSLWFSGCVFTLSTQQDKTDSKNSIMLFRVFPVSDDLKEEWKLAEYDTD